MKRGGVDRSPARDPAKGREHGLGGTGEGRTSGFLESLLRVLGLWGSGEAAAGGLTEAGAWRGAPGEQREQVVATRPRGQVPPVAYFFPDAAAGVGFRGVESSNWGSGLLNLREEGGWGSGLLGPREKGVGAWTSGCEEGGMPGPRQEALGLGSVTDKQKMSRRGLGAQTPGSEGEEGWSMAFGVQGRDGWFPLAGQRA